VQAPYRFNSQGSRASAVKTFGAGRADRVVDEIAALAFDVTNIDPRDIGRRLEQRIEAGREYAKEWEEWRGKFDDWKAAREAGEVVEDAEPEIESTGDDEASGPDVLPGGAGAPFEPPPSRDDRIVDGRVYGDTLYVARVRERDGRTGREVAERLARDDRMGRIKWAVVVSDDVPLDDRTLLLWGIFTRFDAARDVVFGEARLDGAWPRYGGRMAVDATWKPGYPATIEPDPETARRVDRRWGEYGIELAGMSS